MAEFLDVTLRLVLEQVLEEMTQLFEKIVDFSNILLLDQA